MARYLRRLSLIAGSFWFGRSFQREYTMGQPLKCLFSKCVGEVYGREWANLHLLFWLSLIPFATGWMGANHFAAAPTALYGAVLLMAAVAYRILQQLIIASQGPDSMLKKAIGGDWKGKLSLLLYAAAIPLAFWWQ